MALPLNLNVKHLTTADFFLGVLNLCIFSVIKCELIATENICQKFYSFERKWKLNLIVKFYLSFSSFMVKASDKYIFFVKFHFHLRDTTKHLEMCSTNMTQKM